MHVLSIHDNEHDMGVRDLSLSCTDANETDSSQAKTGPFDPTKQHQGREIDSEPCSEFGLQVISKEWRQRS